MKRKHDIVGSIFLILMIVLFVLVIGSFVGVEIYVWARYAGAPVEQIPVWALWLMFRR